MSGWAVQSGWLLEFAAIGAFGSKLMSFCVPATSTVVSSEISIVTVLPGSPVAEPMMIVASVGGGVSVIVGVAVETGVAVTGAVAPPGVGGVGGGAGGGGGGGGGAGRGGGRGGGGRGGAG